MFCYVTQFSTKLYVVIFKEFPRHCKFTKLVAEFQLNVIYTSHIFPLEQATDGLHITQLCARADQKLNCTLTYKV